MTAKSNLIKSNSDLTPEHRTLFQRLLMNLRAYRTTWQLSSFKSFKNKSHELPLAFNNIKIGSMGYSIWPHYKIFPQTDEAFSQFLILLCLHYYYFKVFLLSSRHRFSDPAYLFLLNWFYTQPLLLSHSVYLREQLFCQSKPVNLLSLHL